MLTGSRGKYWKPLPRKGAKGAKVSLTGQPRLCTYRRPRSSKVRGERRSGV